MTFPEHPQDAFVDGNPVTGKLTAAILNVWRRWQTFAIDIENGGVYVPGPQTIQIGGSGITLSGSTQRLGLSSRLITRLQSLAGNTTSANWAIDSITSTADWENTGAGGQLTLELDNLPDGATLDSVTVVFEGASGHANDPVTDGGQLVMPNYELFAVDQDGVATSLDTVTDTVIAQASYEASHEITMSSIGHTIDLTTYRYVIVLVGETGSDFQSGSHLTGLITKSIVTEYPEW